MHYQGSWMDFQSEGTKIVLYLISPGGTSMVDAGGENFVFWFSRARENAFLGAFKQVLFFATTVFVQQKNGEAMAHPPPGCMDPDYSNILRVTPLKYEILPNKTVPSWSCIGSCNYVECKYGAWSAWTTSCGKGQRSRQMQTIRKTVQRESCNGLPTSCPTKPDIQTRTEMCEYILTHLLYVSQTCLGFRNNISIVGQGGLPQGRWSIGLSKNCRSLLPCKPTRFGSSNKYLHNSKIHVLVFPLCLR